MPHELFKTHCTNGTLIMNPFTFIINTILLLTFNLGTDNLQVLAHLERLEKCRIFLRSEKSWEILKI